MQRVQDKPAQGAATLRFFDWSFSNGDKAAGDIDYIVLPASVKALIRKEWGSLKDASGKAVALN
jgi:phosphate transport system substrate-binding protein